MRAWQRTAAWAITLAMAAGGLPGLNTQAAAAKVANKTAAATTSPRFYFRMGEVKAGPQVDKAFKAYAGEALQAELASRPEWASDVGASGEALVGELKKRNLRGFDVTLRMEAVTKEVKDPAPGARLKRLAVSVRLAVFGTTIPEQKLAFSGEGEAGLESEVSDQRMEADGASLAKDAIKDAVRQAVDQAVMKLAVGKAKPMNESRRKSPR